MKKLFFFAGLIMFFTNAKSQLTKGNWLMGGTGSYSRQKSSGADATNSRRRLIELKPNIGYFFTDKFATGLRTDITLTKDKYPQTDGTETEAVQNSFGLGPFVRYYFLNAENRFNIFSDADLLYSNLTVKGTGRAQSSFKTLAYTLSAGGVAFLNSSVGLECMVSYYGSNAFDYDAKGKTISFRIGFQIHLEK